MGRRSPARTPEQRENQLIAMSMDLAEEQIAAGTVSAQVLSYFIKRGSTREKLEEEMIGLRNEHLKAQTEALEAAGRLEGLVEAALTAFKSYAIGSVVEPEELGYDDSQLQ